MNLSDTLGIAALIISIIGIPIAFFLARRTRQRPDLRYMIDFDVILNPSDRLFDQGLYMTLGNDKIDCISRTRIAIWNQRGDTIRKSDILGTDPLRLQFNENDKPLQSRVISASREQIGLATVDSVYQSAVLIDFDFLDAGDGGVLEIIHQGTVKPTVIGTLRGSTVRARGSTSLSPDVLTRIGQKSAIRRWRNNKRPAKIYAIIVGTGTLILLGLAIWIFSSSGQEPSHLVNAGLYNLHTAKGQISFANAITNTTYYSNSKSDTAITIFLICGVTLATAIAINVQYDMIKRKFPGGITNYRLSTSASSHQEEASPDASADH
jgi:hypothetical protein